MMRVIPNLLASSGRVRDRTMLAHLHGRLQECASCEGDPVDVPGRWRSRKVPLSSA